jgi:hypothetical protein
MCKAALLSQCSNAGFGCNICRSFNNDRNQDNSQHVPVIALYSASTEESDTVFCLFVRQETSEEPQKTQ